MGFVCTLPKDVQKAAKEQLQEDPIRRDKDIEHIRAWIRKQPHLNARTDDWTILRFLRGCKFSLEKTKEKIETFYTCRSMVPEWFSNRDPFTAHLKQILDLGLVLPLPDYDCKKRRVIIAYFGAYDPSKFHMNLLIKVGMMLFDLVYTQDPMISVNGIQIIFDCTGLSIGHVTAFTPVIARKFATLLQDGYPIRPKGLHYLYTSSLIDTVIKLLKSGMKEKLRKRIVVHGQSVKSLQKHLGKDVLPEEYGGTNGSISEIKDYWIKTVNNSRSWYLEDQLFGVDESQRLGRPKTTMDLFGMEGSFRRLDVD